MSTQEASDIVNQNPDNRTTRPRDIAARVPGFSAEQKSLLDEWEKECDKKHSVHSRVSNSFTQWGRWLSFAVNVISVIIGTGGCVAFVTEIAQGKFDWGNFIVGIILLLSGILGSIGKSFEWDKQSLTHAVAAGKYVDISTDIRMLKTIPAVSLTDCELYVSRIEAKMSETDSLAPYIPDESLLVNVEVSS